MTAYGTVLTAGYTGDGVRAWKQNASGRTYFLYDGILPVVELDSSGSVTSTNTFGACGLVSRRVGTTSTFYSFDSEGNVSQRSDASGSVLANHLFSAHGSVLSGSLSDPFGYRAQAGYYTDNETGLQLLTHRYYDSSTGRFLTRDPIGFAGGINSYAYVGNSPVLYGDPSGLCPPEKKCKQDKTGGDRGDIEELLKRAGLLSSISNIRSAGPRSPEGVLFDVNNTQGMIAIIRSGGHFTQDIPTEHLGQVGGNLRNSYGFRSYTDSKDGLGVDSTGFIRSLQIAVGPADRDPRNAQRATGYANLDCDNPDQDVISALKHGLPIMFRRIGSIF
jgi:RHS repeat-associated protein